MKVYVEQTLIFRQLPADKAQIAQEELKREFQTKTVDIGDDQANVLVYKQEIDAAGLIRASELIALLLRLAAISGCVVYVKSDSRGMRVSGAM
jgi:hypothetical protein